MRFIILIYLVFTIFSVGMTGVYAKNDDTNIKHNTEALLTLATIDENDLKQTVSREKCVMMVCKAMGITDDEVESYRYRSYYRPVFSDISFERENSGYIFYAGLYSIALGIPDGYMVAGIEVNKFNPDENVTYQEAVTFIMRALDDSQDRLKISIRDAIELAKEKGIICTTDAFVDNMESDIIFDDLCILLNRMLECVKAD